MTDLMILRCGCAHDTLVYPMLQVLALSDPEAAFGKKLGWDIDLTGRNIGLGVRVARGAIILDDLKVVYIEVCISSSTPLSLPSAFSMAQDLTNVCFTARAWY